MSVSKVLRSTSAMASVIYVAYGTREAMGRGQVRAAELSVIGPLGADPVAWAVHTRQKVADSPRRTNEVLHVIQSWGADELDPGNPADVAKAHAIGARLGETLAPGCAIVVATHTDGANLHNHVLIANHDLETGKAAPKQAGNAWHVRRANDELMREFGLEVLAQEPVTLSKQERMAAKAGRNISGDGLTVDTVGPDTWRDFMRGRVEELLVDERVLDAPDDDAAFGVMEAIAGDYDLSFSRHGRGGKRKSKRSSFALVDADGQEVRVDTKTGSITAACAGSKLGADYTLKGLEAGLQAQRAQRDLDELEKEEINGTEPTAYSPVLDDGLAIAEPISVDAAERAASEAARRAATERWLAEFDRRVGGARAPEADRRDAEPDSREPERDDRGAQRAAHDGRQPGPEARGGDRRASPDADHGHRPQVDFARPGLDRRQAGGDGRATARPADQRRREPSLTEQLQRWERERRRESRRRDADRREPGFG